MTDKNPAWLELIPSLSTDEFDALKQDIRDHGVKIPLVYDQHEQLIDGKHRRKACDELGIPEEKIPKDHRRFANDEERLVYVMAMNVKRRHLSTEQKKEIAAKLRSMGKSQERVARLTGIPEGTIAYWEAQQNSHIPTNRSILGTKNVSVPDLSVPDVSVPDLRVSIPRDEQPRIYERIKKGETQARVAADYKVTPRRVGQIVKQVEARSKMPNPVETPPFPEKKYRCIVIDPPWPVKKNERSVRPNQGPHLDYATMTLEEIAELPIGDLAENGCHIYLWTTHKLMPHAFKLFENWGVVFHCLLTWHKKVGVTPFSFMLDTEHVLFGRIGSLDLLKKGVRVCFEGDANRHSEKPDEFYHLVTEVSPKPRLDMFHGKKRRGFERWGVNH